MPLYTEEPRQTPFFNGESQFEERWTVDAVLQMNASITLPQLFAEQVVVSARFITIDRALAAAATAVGVIANTSAGSLTGSVTAASGAGSYATTITGDGETSTFTVQHGLNSTDVLVVVRDPSDANADVPDLDNTAPDPDTVQIVMGAPLPAGAVLRVIVFRA